MTRSSLTSFFLRTLFVGGAFAGLGCEPIASPSTVLLTDETFITGIAVDEFSLYFVKQDGLVSRISLDGGTPSDLASGVTDPRYIALSGDTVFVGTSTGTLARLPKIGGDVEKLVEGGQDIRGLVTDKTHVYFAAGDTVQGLSLDAEDEEPTARAQMQVVPDTLVYSVGTLYWTGGSKSSIQKVPTTGGDATPFPVSQTTATALGADPTFLYWNSVDPDREVGVLRAARHDGTDERTIATDQPQVYRIVADEKNVYWTALDGSVTAAPADGGAEPFVFSSGPAGPAYLTQDLVNIYIARFETGTILARPKDSILPP